MAVEIAVRLARPGFILDTAFVAPAGVTALFGPSGAGKSTVLGAVAGLEPTARGRVVVDGRVLQDDAAGINLPAWRRGVGCVFQDGRLFPHLNVAANLRFGARRAARAAAARVHGFDAVVSMLDLEPLLGRRPASLSGGERQRVAIGRALLSAPDILLMDEPLAALDGARKAAVLPYLEALRAHAGVPVLYVTHDGEEVARLADHVVVLAGGRVIAAGPPRDVADAAADSVGEAAVAAFGATVAARVIGHDEDAGLTRLALAAGELALPVRADLRPGDAVRVRLPARDLALATALPEHSSLTNALPAVVTAIRETAPGVALVDLVAGPDPLRARITRDSVRRLGLVPGMPVWVLVKAAALDRAGLAPG